MCLLTPYAVLSAAPSATDDDIRTRYYSRVRKHHPDLRTDHVPGPEWDALTTAYKAIHNQTERERWMAGRRLLSGFCKACKGYGVNFRAGHCAACAGQGRVV